MRLSASLSLFLIIASPAQAANVAYHVRGQNPSLPFAAIPPQGLAAIAPASGSHLSLRPGLGAAAPTIQTPLPQASLAAAAPAAPALAAPALAAPRQAPAAPSEAAAPTARASADPPAEPDWSGLFDNAAARPGPKSSRDLEPPNEEAPSGSRRLGMAVRLGKAAGTKKLGRFLGKGNASEVYQLLDEPAKAIRLQLPHKGGNWYDVSRLKDLMESFIQGRAELARAGVPTVAIHEHSSPRYAVVDYIEGPLLLDLLLHPGRFSGAERDRMLRGLTAFARTTAVFKAIGDFKPDQLLFDRKRGWVLFDWVADHARNDRLEIVDRWRSPPDVFNSMRYDPEHEPLFSDRRLRGGSERARRWVRAVMALASAAVADERRFLRPDYPGHERTDFTARIARLAGLAVKPTRAPDPAR